MSLLVRLLSQKVIFMKSLLSSTLTKLWVLVVLALMFLSIVLFHYVVLFITSSFSVFIFTLSLLNGIYTASSLFLNQEDKSLIQNYRPISLLCSISKVLEWHYQTCLLLHFWFSVWFSPASFHYSPVTSIPKYDFQLLWSEIPNGLYLSWPMKGFW